jgi:hypothetical protein
VTFNHGVEGSSPSALTKQNQILISEKTQPTHAKIGRGSEQGNEIALVDGPTGRSPSTKCARPVLAALSTSKPIVGTKTL